jgi:hypothetical protein
MESNRVIPLSANGTGSNMMARMWSAAKRARAYGRSRANEKEALFCATLIARLAQTLNATAIAIDPMQHCWLDRPGMLDGHIHWALSHLESEDPDSGWRVRNALGLGVVDDQREKCAARLQAMVNLAWMQASMPLARKHGSGRLTTERSMRV